MIHPILQTDDYNPRLVFDDIKETCDIFFSSGKTVRMIGLAGLRGTGKTSLLWQNPDFVIETLPKPVVIDKEMNNKSTTQMKNSKIDYKFSIIINSKASEISIFENDNVLILPLKYFLLL